MDFLIKLLIAIFAVYLACTFLSYQVLRSLKSREEGRNKKRDLALASIIGVPCLIFVTLSPWFSSFIERL